MRRLRSPFVRLVFRMATGSGCPIFLFLAINFLLEVLFEEMEGDACALLLLVLVDFDAVSLPEVGDDFKSIGLLESNVCFSGRLS